MDTKDYEYKRRDGACAIILHGRKALLLKRRNLPFLTNPGVWSFVFGRREEGEGYEDTAYREIAEETGIGKEHLEMLGKPLRIALFDGRRRQWWRNMLFVFRCSTSEVRIDFESAGWRWASLRDIERQRLYTNVFIDEETILRLIRRYIDE